MLSLRTASALLLSMLTLGCAGTLHPSEAHPTAEPEPRTQATLCVQRPPPAGIPCPRDVRFLEVNPGDSNDLHRWFARVRADPSARALQDRIIAKGRTAESYTLGNAAFEQYREDVQAAGYRVLIGFSSISGFDFNAIGPDGPLSVSVRATAHDPHTRPYRPGTANSDEHGAFFEIIVTPAGG